MIDTKRCSGCRQSLKRDQFHRRKASNDGLQSRCKACQIAFVLRTVDPARVRRTGRDYSRRHPEKAQAYRELHRKEINAAALARYYRLKALAIAIAPIV